MVKKPLSQMGLAALSELADMQEEIADDPWASFEKHPLTADDEQQIALVLRRYRGIHVTTINEATAWARLVYPLLLTAERGDIKAWAEVPVAAQIGETEIQGIVDGALAPGIDSPWAPLLLVLEAKRGTEASNPTYPLYAALLCVGWNEMRAHGSAEHTSYGCYTIADSWTFVEARVQDGEVGERTRPRLHLRWSRDYSERTEAHAIVAILKGIQDAALAKTVP